jgi:hypothetical protein
VKSENLPVPENTLLLGLILCGVAVVTVMIQFFTR